MNNCIVLYCIVYMHICVFYRAINGINVILLCTSLSNAIVDIMAYHLTVIVTVLHPSKGI